MGGSGEGKKRRVQGDALLVLLDDGLPFSRLDHGVDVRKGTFHLACKE